MANNKTITAGLSLDTSPAEKALASFNKTVQNSDRIFASFAGNLAASFASSAIAAFGNTISGAFSKAIEEANNAEREITALNTALRANGLYSKETSDRFVELADVIEMNSLYTGGAIQENVALLASMTSLNEQGIERTIKAATELAALYDLDLTTATQALAKASNGNVTALSKLGFEVDKTKSSAQQFESVLASLESRQGAAAAKANTFEGAQHKLRESTNKVYEAIGNLIIQNPAIISSMQGIAQAMVSVAERITAITEFVKRNSDAFELLAVGAGIVGVSLVSLAAKTAVATTGFTVLTGAATAAWIAITGPVGRAIAGIALVGTAVYAVYKYWDNIALKFYELKAQWHEWNAKLETAIGSRMAAQSRADAAEARGNVERIKAKMAAAEADTKATAVETQNAGKRKQVADEEYEAKIKKLNDWVQKLSEAYASEDEQNKSRLELVKVRYDEESALETEAESRNYALKLERERAFYAEQQALRQEQLNQELARVEGSTLSESEKLNARLKLEQDYYLASEKLRVEQTKKEQSLLKSKTDFEKQQNRERLQASASLFGALGDLAMTGNRSQFEAGKAFAIAEATIQGFLAVQRALASAPPPFNFAAAAAVGIQTGLQVSRISQQQMPAFENGGIVPGVSYSGDNVMARVNSGEMILNKQQQSNLFSQINQGFSNEAVGLLRELVSAVREGSVIEIDGKQIATSIKNAQLAGY